MFCLEEITLKHKREGVLYGKVGLEIKLSSDGDFNTSTTELVEQVKVLSPKFSFIEIVGDESIKQLNTQAGVRLIGALSAFKGKPVLVKLNSLDINHALLSDTNVSFQLEHVVDVKDKYWFEKYFERSFATKLYSLYNATGTKPLVVFNIPEDTEVPIGNIFVTIDKFTTMFNISKDHLLINVSSEAPCYKQLIDTMVNNNLKLY